MPGEEFRTNPHASSGRWRHQESSAYSKFAGQQAAEARDPIAAGNTTDLANFINKSSRLEPDSHGGGNYKPVMVAAGHAEGDDRPEDAPEDGRGEVAEDGKLIVCGPLLNYRRMDDGRWHGSVLIVTRGGGTEAIIQPSLILRRVGAVGELLSATEQANGAVDDKTGGTRSEGTRLYSDPRNTFWQFDVVVPIEEVEAKYEYFIPELRFSTDYKPKVNSFFVPSVNESFRCMFHSCNGFSVGTDEDAWSGACLWNDVMRKHEVTPYHVMLGGGDQIYNDGIRVNGPLRPWTEIHNPQKRRDYPFPDKLRAECDDYYLKNYIRWYNTEPFSSANGQIPQLNIWDDHDVSQEPVGQRHRDSRLTLHLLVDY